MKSLDEIKAKIKQDVADPIESVMVVMCNGVHPLMFCVADYYKDDAKDKVIPLTRENVIKEMQGYIDFAFEKAHDKRGLSAKRSIWRYQQWLWVLEDTEITDFDFNDFGISLLNHIAKKYGLKTEADEYHEYYEGR